MRFTFLQPRRWLLVVTVLLLSGRGLLFAQAPAWQWASNPGLGQSSSTAVDAAGNVYVTGLFRGIATFGATTLTSAGSGDIFVAKLTSTGTYQWAVRAGGSGSFDTGTGIAVDNSGFVVVTGAFDSPTATFGSITLTRTGSSSTDAFVARLTPTGTWQWVTGAGGTQEDRGTAVAVDGTGAVTVTGSFEQTATVGDSTFVTNTGGGFVARLTPAGTWQWVVPTMGNTAYATAVAVDGTGHVAITGQLRGTSIIGDTSFTVAAGYTDMFVARLTPAGAWQWVVRITGPQHEYGVGLTVDGTGRVLVTGQFYDTVAFGATTLTSSGDEDIFVARLTPAGVWEWAARAGGSGYDNGHSVAVESSGHVLVTGAFMGTAAFGTTTLTGSGLVDVFVARLTPAGAWQWAVSAGGNGHDRGYGVAVDGTGHAVLSGSFTNRISFGTTTLNSSSSLFAIFIARLGTLNGLPDGADESRLTLIPNPARTMVQLTGATGPTAILLDGLGRLARTAPITPAGAATLDVRTLPAGIYLLRAGGATRRLVVE